MRVELELDRPGAFRVIHDGLAVVPAHDRLIVGTAEEVTGPVLVRCTEAIARCMESLPETPVTAIGVNIRFRYDALPVRAIQLCSSELEELLADHSFEIAGKFNQRTLAWNGGKLNVQIKDEPENPEIAFNFHLDSKVHAPLRTWLGRVNEMLTVSEQLKVLLEEEVRLND